MSSIVFLLKHSGVNLRRFWLGLAGKLVCELLPACCWLLLFGFIAGGWAFSLYQAIGLSVVVIAGQWFFGQSARENFLQAYDITHHLRKALLQDIRSQPMSFITGKGLGERVRLITKDLKNFEDVFSHLVADFVASLMIPMVMMTVLFTLSFSLGCLMLVALLLAWLILSRSDAQFSRRANDLQRDSADCANQMLEYVECLPMLKQCGRSDRLAAPLCAKIESLRKSGLGLEWAGGLGVVFAILLLELFVPAIAFYAVTLVSKGQLAAGQGVVAVIAVVTCARPFVRMTVFATFLRFMVKSAHRLQSLASAPQQPRSGTRPEHSELRLNNVSLELSDKTVLQNINIDIAPGEHVALIGASGAGKSTLLDVIAAFHIPSHGSVHIGDLTLDQIGTHHWYQQVSYVTQKVQLCSGTLRDNLLIANRMAESADLDRVIELSGLGDLVSRLPQGLNSDIGEEGNQLSGGEKQRLSIARALLRDAPIVLLDEFTSALDHHTQKAILRSLEQTFSRKTLITVAHRLETTMNAERIYFMERGAITDVGRHNELLLRCQPYQNLWNAQQSA